jgi:ABC-2 type transport system ATP-binding protein
MASVITIDKLSVVLGGEYRALRNISVELDGGKITGFIGPSGAGKTTLIRAIVGRQRITSGRVTALGLPAGSKPLRSRVSYMTQEISVYDDLTVHENIRYFASMAGYSRQRLREVCSEALAAVDMAHKAGVLVSSLSGGQKQRVSLAVALIGEPELLVLDEPTVGLDPVLREQLWKLFRELASQGKTIIISSHVMDEAERCDSLLLIRDGQLVAYGTPHELCERTGTKTVEQSFLKLAGGAS